MLSKTKSLYWALFLLIPVLGFSQEALTWDDCVKEASQNNKDLLTAEQTVKADEDSHVASLGQFFPQITFDASINRSGVGGFNDALTSSQYDQNSGLSLNLSQDIFAYKDFSAVDQANAQLDLARDQLTQAKSQLSHDLKAAFYQLLYSQQQIDLLNQILARDQANQNLVQMNFDGGTDNKGSLLQAQAAVAQDQFSVDQAVRALRVAQSQLDQVLGRSQMDNLVVQGDFDTPTLGTDEPDFMKITIETPAHLEAVAQLGLSDSQYETARGVFFPTISANASLNDGGWNFGKTQNPTWEGDLDLSIPVFTGGKDLFNFKSAEESKKGTEDTLESTDLKTESQLETDYAAYVDAVEEIKVQQLQVQAAETQEEIAKAEYLNGLLIFENWNQIEEALTNQQKTLLSDLLNVKTTEAAWELTQGKGEIP
jgi:outer membrane protein TolC